MTLLQNDDDLQLETSGWSEAPFPSSPPSGQTRGKFLLKGYCGSFLSPLNLSQDARQFLSLVINLSEAFVPLTASPCQA